MMEIERRIKNSFDIRDWRFSNDTPQIKINNVYDNYCGTVVKVCTYHDYIEIL